jgi:hypothetical protein
MPFVRIDALRAGQAKLDALGRAVHEALVDAPRDTARRAPAEVSRELDRPRGVG